MQFQEQYGNKISTHRGRKPVTETGCGRSSTSNIDIIYDGSGSSCTFDRCTRLSRSGLPEIHQENISCIRKKTKRKLLNQDHEWNERDSVKALMAENSLRRSKVHPPTLIIKFPDEEVNPNVVMAYSENIKHVHFEKPFTARYCFVQLHSDVDPEKVKDELSQIPFGTGKLSVDYKYNAPEQSNPIDIDPYTLFVGNLPIDLSVRQIQRWFPLAKRLDIGFSQCMKNTRYAFVYYGTVDAAIKGLTDAQGIVSRFRTLIFRFRRNKDAKNHAQVPKRKRFFMDNNPIEEIDSQSTILNSLDSTNNFNYLDDENDGYDENVETFQLDGNDLTEIDTKYSVGRELDSVIRPCLTKTPTRHEPIVSDIPEIKQESIWYGPQSIDIINSDSDIHEPLGHNLSLERHESSDIGLINEPISLKDEKPNVSITYFPSDLDADPIPKQSMSSDGTKRSAELKSYYQSLFSDLNPDDGFD